LLFIKPEGEVCVVFYVAPNRSVKKIGFMWQCHTVNRV